MSSTEDGKEVGMPSSLLNIVIGVNGYEVGRFGESIYDHVNRIKLAGCQSLQ
jgi:hypothetical protein